MQKTIKKATGSTVRNASRQLFQLTNTTGSGIRVYTLIISSYTHSFSFGFVNSILPYNH
ncbi:MAG TPA: hypothetical protein VGB71_07080 [Flavisolibacter sp.]